MKGESIPNSAYTVRKKLKAGFHETDLDRNKQELLLEAERLELRVNSFLRSGFGCNPFTILKHSTNIYNILKRKQEKSGR